MFFPDNLSVEYNLTSSFPTAERREKILYLQNGEEFERQHMGHISGNVDFFRNAGDVDVTFELLQE